MPQQPDGESPTAGARRARLEQRRAQRSRGFGRFLWLGALGSLVPGTGLIASGRRVLGGVVLGLFVVAVAVGAVFLLSTPTPELARFVIDHGRVVGIGLAVAAALWLAVSLLSHRSLEPRGLSAGRRAGGALVVVLATSLVVAPLSVASRTSLTARDTIESISLPSGEFEGGGSNTTPEIDVEDPWAGKPRVNILLLGGDGGDNRTGVRPDTQMVASIDTETGDTLLFQIPRNLQNVPFPDGSPLQEAYPNGFTGPGDPNEYLINAVYQNVPATVDPSIFAGVANPGADANKWAVEGALGIDIDYYVLVNLDGFQTIVDALGGVTINVPEDIPIGGRSEPGVGCVGTTGTIEAGPDQRLNGYRALWYARSRCASDDYDRMDRQRCMMGAIIREADPITLARQFQSLAAATRDIVQTDIPSDIFGDFLELTLRVKDGEISSLPFNTDIIDPASPDYDAIHAVVQEALAPPEPEPEPEPDDGADNGGAGDSGSASPTPPDAADLENLDDLVDEPDPSPSESEAAEPADITTVC